MISRHLITHIMNEAQCFCIIPFSLLLASQLCHGCWAIDTFLCNWINQQIETGFVSSFYTHTHTLSRYLFDQQHKCWTYNNPALFCLQCQPSLAHSFLFCSCVYFCLYGPFNSISFHKFSRQLSVFSLCSSGLMSALLVLSTISLYESLLQPWYNP